MNIFYLDHDVELCAQYHTDKHCVKMILEYAQLLSVAHRVLDGEQMQVLSNSGKKVKRYVLADLELNENLYQDSHTNHPSSAWVRQSRDNYTWLYNLWVKLMEEYTYRYGKVHASSRLLKYLVNLPANISSNAFSEPPPAMPDEYKDSSSVKAYHNYYNNGKRHIFKWTKRDIPYFIQ